MYYKITNKDSEIYKKLHAFRSNELRIDNENKELIKSKISEPYITFYGYPAQTSNYRTNVYMGFVFENPENLDPKVWVKHKDYDDRNLYIPNSRTKTGREMKKFLHDLKSSYAFALLFDILKLETRTSFSLPYLEICEDDTIVLMIDQYSEIDNNADFIEITSKEFDSILSNNHTK